MKEHASEKRPSFGPLCEFKRLGFQKLEFGASVYVRVTKRRHGKGRSSARFVIDVVGDAKILWPRRAFRKEVIEWTGDLELEETIRHSLLIAGTLNEGVQWSKNHRFEVDGYGRYVSGSLTELKTL